MPDSPASKKKSRNRINILNKSEVWTLSCKRSSSQLRILFSLLNPMHLNHRKSENSRIFWDRIHRSLLRNKACSLRNNPKKHSWKSICCNWISSHRITCNNSNRSNNKSQNNKMVMMKTNSKEQSSLKKMKMMLNNRIVIMKSYSIYNSNSKDITFLSSCKTHMAWNAYRVFQNRNRIHWDHH